MRKLAISIILMAGIGVLLAGCNLGYGPLRDESKFVNARLAEDARSVIFSFHDFAYRPAAGARAFPDGGIPRYVRDTSIFATYDIETHHVAVLRKQENRRWQPGQGTFWVQAISGTRALVSQGGQLRDKSEQAVTHFLVDFRSGTQQDIDLKGDLARLGRDLGQIYLVDTDGTLVFVTLSLAEAGHPSAYRDSSLVPEIWVRTSAGEYLEAAKSSHYYGVKKGELIYWMPDTRLYMAFDIRSRVTRQASEFKETLTPDVTLDVRPTSDKRGLEYGTRTNYTWNYKTLPLTPEMIK